MSFEMAEPRCFARGCKHFEGVKEVGGRGEQYQKVVCPAFPRGIPDDIAYGKNDHLTVDPRQVGVIVFEKV